MASCEEFEVTVHTSPGPTCGTFNRLWLTLIGLQGETPPITVNKGDHHLLPGSVSFIMFPQRDHLMTLQMSLNWKYFKTNYSNRSYSNNNQTKILSLKVICWLFTDKLSSKFWQSLPLCWQMCPIRVKANSPLGCLVLIRLHLEAETGFPDLDWHCSRVEVRRLADRQAEEGGEGGTAPEDPEVQVFLCDRWLRTADGDVELRSGKCKINLWFFKILLRKSSKTLSSICVSWRTEHLPHFITKFELEDLWCSI